MPADPLNVRLKFMSPISHNVMGFSVPSVTNAYLRPYVLNVDGTNNTNRPLTSTSRLYCTDCHNNNQARAFNGTGPNGPHGSTNTHLLISSLSQESGGGGGGNSYALCDRCHNVASLLAASTLHSDHHQGYPCSDCHDPHGVIGGTATNNRGLTNFDTFVVKTTNPYYGIYSTTAGRGTCYLTCHGQNHNPQTYPGG